MTNDFEMVGIFPCPIYIATRDLDLDSTEEKEIEDLITDGICKDGDLDYHTENTNIFDTSLKNLKEFCEHHIKNYAKEILNAEEELNFYITQSWLNVIESGGNIKRHLHSNSIISGCFYVSTEKDDAILFNDPNRKIKLQVEPNEYNDWNSGACHFPVINNRLLLFPSWLEHEVMSNKSATTKRISLAFNTFATGVFGNRGGLNNLILK